jgi:hypothetical protein
MTIINIRTNFPEVTAQLKRLADDVGNKALVRSLNKTIDQGKTQMARTISQEFRIAVGAAKDRLKVSKASAKGGNVRFEVQLEPTRPAKGRGMNLIHFVTRIPKRTKKGTLGQVQLQIKRQGGRKTITGAFVATNRKTGGTALFIRTSKSRYPIKTLTTIDIPQMFNTKRINAAVVQVMRDKFEANFDRELNVIMKGYLK